MMVQTFTTVWSAGCAHEVDGMALLSRRAVTQDQFEPLTWGLYEMGRQQTASSYLIAVTMQQMMSRAVARFFLDHDVWLTPTVAEPPVPLGTFDSPPFLRATPFGASRLGRRGLGATRPSRRSRGARKEA
jgi:amidase